MLRRAIPPLCSLLCLLLLFAHVVQALQSPLENAWALAAKGNHPQAIAILRDILEHEPANVDARLLLGSLLSEQGEHEQAIAELTQAVHLRPKSSEAFNALGEACNKAGDLPEARRAFEQAIALSPAYAVAQSNLGAVLLQLGELSAAAKHLDLAIPLLRLSSDAADAEYLRAKICTTKDDFSAARSHLERAVSIRPDFSEAWSDLGLACKATGDDPAALAAYRRAVELNPQGAIAQYRLGVQYLRSGQADLALSPLEAAERLNPNDQSTLNALQNTLQQLNRPAEAAIIRSRLAECLHARDVQRQNDIRALQINNDGAAMEKEGKFPEAVDRYREAAALSPDHSGIHINYGMALLRVGNWTQGLTELHRALELDPHNKQLKLVLQDALTKSPRKLLPGWVKSSP